MTKRALLIGSQILGLKGCDADIELMADVLKDYEFSDIQCLPTASATRAGITEGLDALITKTTADDAAVVYFSGHGKRDLRSDYAAAAAAGKSLYFQYLLPTDIEESTRNDFRGILAEELASYQRRLTDRFTKHGLKRANVTTILDCCFSGYLARGAPFATPKSPPEEFSQWDRGGIPKRLNEIRELSAEPTASSSESNPYAVRIAACQTYQSSVEQPGPDGKIHGLLSQELRFILKELESRRVSWRVIAHELRRRVLMRRPEQRPDVEGPDWMIPFTLEEDPLVLSFPVTIDGDDLVIESALVLGVTAGDRLRLVEAITGRLMGETTVSAVEGGRAQLDMKASSVRNFISAGIGKGDTAMVVQAVPVTLHLPRRPVRVDVSSVDVSASLHSTLDESRHVRPATSFESAFATIEGNGSFIVRDGVGARVRTSAFAPDDEGRRNAVQLTELLSMGRRLAELRSGDETGMGLGDPVEVTLEVIEGPHRTVQPLAGARLQEGTRLSLTLQNTLDQPVYTWVFDIGISGRVSLSTQGHPSGLRLEHNGSPESRYQVWSTGVELGWPSDVPIDPVGPDGSSERPETFVVLTADKPQDLRALATDTLDANRGEVPLRLLGRSYSGGSANDLGLILDEVAEGDRSYPAGSTPALRYSVSRVEFFVTPAVSVGKTLNEDVKPSRGPRG